MRKERKNYVENLKKKEKKKEGSSPISLMSRLFLEDDIN